VPQKAQGVPAHINKQRGGVPAHTKATEVVACLLSSTPPFLSMGVLFDISLVVKIKTAISVDTFEAI